MVTGDFYAAAHGDPVHGTLLGAGPAGTRDAAAERGERYGTLHRHRPPVPGGTRIDWIRPRRT
ncbi:hypothetical protein ACIF8T_11375 [Streptomyces sp. NPDC085946]|uniref:hypothetical protein n=1 Tax=Streptomyces sp. NPDC085946 TaxID=3365744 RepID=UPI0037D978DD